MSQPEDSIRSLSEEVMGAARTAAFALMKANYREIDAWEMPGGKLKGLKPQERDIAVRLRESIWYRFDALRFHHELIRNVHAGYTRSLTGMGITGAENYHTTLSAILREQALFDGLVFHSISLFDYLGNATWFGFHGKNHIKKKWKNAYRATVDRDFEDRVAHGDRRINGSKTGTLIKTANEDFVSQLAKYRASLFHYHVDSASGGVTAKFDDEHGAYRPELRIHLPKDYVRTVKGLVDGIAEAAEEALLIEGAAMLIHRVGDTTLEILHALAEDLEWDASEGLTILS